MRRYEVDSVRSIALILLIFYHIIISFTPETKAIYFIVNTEKDTGTDFLMILSQALNIWRIPVLFLIAGMAFYFSSQRRGNQQLIRERSVRIIIPLFFCSIFITPIYFFIFSNFYKINFQYWPAPAYLWFLNSIFYYSLLALPIISIKKTNAKLFNFLNNLLKNKFIMLFLFSTPLIVIAGIFNPESYSNFVNFAGLPFLPVGDFNVHGFFVGLICFLIGFLFASSGDIFWNSVRNIKFIALILAITLFVQRLILYSFPVWEGGLGAYPLVVSNILIAFEAVCWMLAFIGLASSFLNKKNRVLTYMTAAIFPMYIFHMPVQQFLATIIYPLTLAPFIKLILMFSLTTFICILLYEAIRRLKGFRVVFGLKP